MRGVRRKLVVWNVIGIAFVLASMGVALRVGLRQNLLNQIDRELEQSVSGVTIGPGATPSLLAVKDQFVQRSIVSEKKSEVRLIEPRAPQKNGSSLTEVLRGGANEVTLRSDLPVPRLIPVPIPHHPLPHVAAPFDQSGYELAAQGNRQFRNGIEGGAEYRTLSVPIRSGSHVFAVVQARRDLTAFHSQLHNLDITLCMLIPAALLISALFGAVMVGTAMRPLRRLAESAAELAPDLSGKRLPTDGDDEFSELAQTFNHAFDRTAAAFSAQAQAMRQLERFTADAGHELRTPLGAVKGSASFLLHSRTWGEEDRTPLEIINRASDRMERLIADLLLLARRDGQSSVMAATAVSIPCLIAEVLTILPAPSSGVCIELDLGSDIVAIGDGEALSRVFTNLLSNAFAFARHRVRLSGSREEGHLNVAVEDDGEGIAPEHLARLGERFYRPDTARSRNTGGTGLGLAIAKSLVEAMDGNLVIESTLGVGTRVTVRLPA